MSDECRSAEIDELVATLTDSSRAQSPARFPADTAEAATAGLYSWWADEEARASLALVVGEELPPLVYVGQAGATRWPSGKPSAATLGSRIGSQHIRGNARSSTFRLTISCLLVEAMGLDMEAGRLASASNTRISSWIAEHLRVAISSYPDRDRLGAVEAAVVAAIDPPLNLDHCGTSSVRVQLRGRRARFRASPVNQAQGRHD